MENQVLSSVPVTKVGNDEDREYEAFLAHQRRRFHDVMSAGSTPRGARPLYTTNVVGLWDDYLTAFEPAERQFHNCHACKHFIERFGGLVTLSEQGEKASAFWVVDDAPELYRPAIAAMLKLIRRAEVDGIFYSSLECWGQPKTGVWRHFAFTPPREAIFTHPVLSDNQAMAEKREDRGNVLRALGQFDADVVNQAVQLLKSDGLERSEKVLGPAEWLSKLHAARKAAHGSELRSAVTWRFIAEAPPGFCHPSSSMIGTLLEDLASGMDFNLVAERFKRKMNPGAYQRPQAAPTAGAIDAAEKLVEKLGVARSLERRFARLDELQVIWTPIKEEAPAGGGVFAHLQPKNAGAKMPERVMPARAMTWDKFARTVLPEAKQIAIYVPPLGVFAQLVTAEHADAPPLVQWDRLEQRNPVAWYVGREPTHSTRWGLSPGSWITLTAITRQPNEWFGGDFPHHGEGAFLIIKGAKDRETGHGGLFPENLKAEFHGIRSVIEAYSKTAKLGGIADASACGIMMRKGVHAAARLQVAMPNGVVGEYIIDRWD